MFKIVEHNFLVQGMLMLVFNVKSTEYVSGRTKGLDLWIFSWGCFLLKPRSKPIWRVSSLRFPRMERQKEYLQFPLVDRHNNHQRT